MHHHFACLNLCLMLLTSIVLSACGTTGGTTRAVIPLDALSVTGPIRPIMLDSLAHEEEGIRLMSVGVVGWGRFDGEDLANIQASLSETLRAATGKYASSNQEPLRIHVLIRKYFVGASNNAGAVFAGIDWAAVASGNVLFHESFYATGECRLTCTLGGVKDAVNLAMVKRIAQKAVVLGSGRRPDTSDAPGTYSAFERAVATMPNTLQSWHNLVLGRAPTMILVTAEGGKEKLTFEWAEMRTPFDWNSRLQGAPH